MKIGTNILILPLHNVVDVAEQYATLDVICGGRLIMGVGLGYREVEYQNFGVDKRTRGQLFAEQIDALKLLWETDHASFSGQHVNFQDISIRPRPVQRPRPPIWIGAAADPAVKRAALMGDAWIATSVTTYSEIKEHLGFYHRSREEAGLPRNSQFAKCVELYVAETREKAMEEGGAHIAEKYRAYFSWGMGDNVPGESGKALSLEELARDRIVIGTPEDCIEACRAHRDELGCSHLIVRMNFPGMPQRNVINAIELFGREVLPHLN